MKQRREKTAIRVNLLSQQPGTAGELPVIAKELLATMSDSCHNRCTGINKICILGFLLS